MDPAKDICPNCKSENSKIIDYKQGEIVCRQCGYIFEQELVDEHCEQRFFSKTFSSKGISNKELSRVEAPVNTLKFNHDFNNGNNNKFLGKKTKNKDDNNINGKNKFMNEKEKKLIKRENDLFKIDMELRKICNFFNINKMIYEESKELIIKLYEYGSINLRSSFWKLILGLIINYTLKNKTKTCFSKKEISNYFKCDIDLLKKEAMKIYPILTNSNTFLELNNNNNIKITEENKLEKYFAQLQKDIFFLIKKTKIKTLTGILDSYDIIKIYITNNIFNTEIIPSICLAGGALIFCVKLYNIQFMIKNKSTEKSDEYYNMDTPEEEEKLINYIAKKCGNGINNEKIKAVYKRMVKNMNILKDNENYSDFLDNINQINENNK